MSPTSDLFRRLPAVDALLGEEPFAPLRERYGRPLLLQAIRSDLDALREAIARGAVEDLDERLRPEACAERVARALAEATRPAYARVLNATGVILHTGLGRAPIA
ncbi:MAG: L-seryl-tRNA(Sec) selenium transferase, partial [Planctomycetota bacterium]